MNLGEYQRAAFLTANKGMSENDMLTHAVLGLAGGTGEVVEILNKLSRKPLDTNISMGSALKNLFSFTIEFRLTII